MIKIAFTLAAGTVVLGLVAIVSAPATTGAVVDTTLAIEARLAARHPGRFVRNGTTLRIGENSFTDAGRCADDDADCVVHRADAVFGEFVGVAIGYYEGSDYYLVGPRITASVAIGDRPSPSPDGKRFFVLINDEMNEWTPLHGAAVWEWRSWGPVRLRVVDYHLQVIERFVAWRGNACVEMLAARPNTPLVWLAEQAGDWRLFDKRPTNCPGGTYQG